VYGEKQTNEAVFPSGCKDNNRPMKLYYRVCIENNRNMKLYSHRFMENNKQRSCFPLLGLGVWTITDKWSCIPLGV
jgi:hypothetical protein